MQAFIFDTETASLQGGVCDIAIALIDDQFNVVDQVESLINPERAISPTASGIHHITDDMVRDAPTLDQFMAEQGHPFHAAEHPVLGGHNVQFDIRVCGNHIPVPYTKLCTLKLARNLWPNAENHQLQTLRYMFGLDAGAQAHRAMADVITCISLLRRIGEEYGCDLQGVVNLAKKPLSLDAKMPFGKHQGERLRSIPISYVRWLVEKADIDPDLREALATRLA